MPHHEHDHDHYHEHITDHGDYDDSLIHTLDEIPNQVDIILFTPKKNMDVFSKATIKMMEGISASSASISFSRYPLDHKKAKEFGVNRAPALVFNPGKYNIRWFGAPIGEEAAILTEIILALGFQRSGAGEESKKVLEKLKEKRKVKVFVSPSCPYCPQQAVNVLKACVEKPELVSMEIIDVQINQDIAREYETQSVPQTFADDVLIGSGAQQEEVFMQSLLEKEEKTVFIPEITSGNVEVDVLIVGGGPAGLTAGIFIARSGLSGAVVEKGALGGQVAVTPVVENYPGLQQVGGKTLVDLMISHALQYVSVFQGEEVISIEPKEGNRGFSVTTSRRNFSCRAIVLATGATHRKLSVKGEKRLSGRGVSYCSTCDGPFFKNKKVILVGGGNSAVTEAVHLAHIGVEVSLVHRKGELRAQKTLVENLYDAGVEVRFYTEVKEILGRHQVEEVLLLDNQTGELYREKTNGVFIAIGYDPLVSLATKTGVQLTEEGYIRTDSRHRTNIAGIYGAGDVEGGYKQIVVAAGHGAEAAMAVFEDLISPYWT